VAGAGRYFHAMNVGRLRRLGAAAALILACAPVLGCSKVKVRSYIGGPCSTSSDEDPFYECDPAYDLVCMDNVGDGKYFCRIPCKLDPPTPCEKGDVCCPGEIHGDDLGYERGCTPKLQCPVGPNYDASTPTDASGESSGGKLDGGA